MMPFSCHVYALTAAGKRQLKLAGTAVPMSAPSGRNPTPKELKAVLSEDFADYHAEVFTPDARNFGTGWHAEVWHALRPALHPWAFVVMDMYRGEDTALPIQFVRGTPEFMVQIVQALAARLGPLVIQPDVVPPMVVQPGSGTAAFVEAWRAGQPPPVKRRTVPTALRPGAVDLNGGMIEASLRPEPGYRSKHSFQGKGAEGRLSGIDWFANCGSPCSVDLSVEIDQVARWEHAMESRGAHRWKEVGLAARNQLSGFLFGTSSRPMLTQAA